MKKYNSPDAEIIKLELDESILVDNTDIGTGENSMGNEDVVN